MSEVAGRLRAVRAYFGHSQRKMATLVGVKYRSWQDYESGKNVPGGRVFASLAELGVNTNWLLIGRGTMFLSTDSSDADSDPLASAGGLMQSVADCLRDVMLEMAPTLSGEQRNALTRAFSSLYARLCSAAEDGPLLELLESYLEYSEP